MAALPLEYVFPLKNDVTDTSAQANTCLKRSISLTDMTTSWSYCLQASDLDASVVVLGGVVGAGDQGALVKQTLTFSDKIAKEKKHGRLRATCLAKDEARSLGIQNGSEISGELP